jgi:hypothetical protein
MQRNPFFPWAVFFQLKAVRVVAFVFCRNIIAFIAFRASQCNIHAHDCISLQTFSLYTFSRLFYDITFHGGIPVHNDKKSFAAKRDHNGKSCRMMWLNRFFCVIKNKKEEIV